jgi:MFS family permease
MQDTGIWLIAFAIISFAIGLIAGLTFHRSRVWNWADPVYYVIGVAGVVLLFLSSERIRVLTDLRSELIEAQQQLVELNVRPPVDAPQRKADQETSIGKIQAQIKAINQQEEKSTFQNFMDFIISHFWPFVLTFALAIKFARGVAVLRR